VRPRPASPGQTTTVETDHPHGGAHITLFTCQQTSVWRATSTVPNAFPGLCAAGGCRPPPLETTGVPGTAARPHRFRTRIGGAGPDAGTDPVERSHTFAPLPQPAADPVERSHTFARRTANGRWSRSARHSSTARRGQCPAQYAGQSPSPQRGLPAPAPSPAPPATGSRGSRPPRLRPLPRQRR